MRSLTWCPVAKAQFSRVDAQMSMSGVLPDCEFPVRVSARYDVQWQWQWESQASDSSKRDKTMIEYQSSQIDVVANSDSTFRSCNVAAAVRTAGYQGWLSHFEYEFMNFVKLGFWNSKTIQSTCVPCMHLACHVFNLKLGLLPAFLHEFDFESLRCSRNLDWMTCLPFQSVVQE